MEYIDNKMDLKFHRLFTDDSTNQTNRNNRFIK